MVAFGPVVQLVRTPACHAGGRRFESVPGRQFRYADMAQAVERVLGKDEVGGSSPPISSSCAAIAAQFFYACFQKTSKQRKTFIHLYII